MQIRSHLFASISDLSWLLSSDVHLLYHVYIQGRADRGQGPTKPLKYLGIDPFILLILVEL